MTTVYIFKGGFTKLGLAVAPSSAPTITIVDTSNNLLVNAASASSLSNLTGAYYYSYSGADDLSLIGKFATADLTVDQSEVFAEPELKPSNVWGYATRTLTSGYLSSSDIWEYNTTDLTTSGTIGKMLVDRIDAAISTRSTLGAGAISWDILVNDGSNPIDGVDVWITTDSGGTNIIARGETDDTGIVTFMLDAGTYYAWKQLAGWTFTNPETITVV